MHLLKICSFEIVRLKRTAERIATNNFKLQKTTFLVTIILGFQSSK